VDLSGHSQSPLLRAFDALVSSVEVACRRHYGDRLVSIAVFGSVGRRTPRADSDVDLLLIVESLPDGRTARMAEFAPVELALARALADARAQGVETRVSPVLKTPAELAHGSPLMLDMVDDARLIVDRDGVLARALEALRARLAARGARRIWRGNAWYWDLKPDYRPGEVFDL
jgi:predicted nucleotidyltransferase